MESVFVRYYIDSPRSVSPKNWKKVRMVIPFGRTSRSRVKPHGKEMVSIWTSRCSPNMMLKPARSCRLQNEKEKISQQQRTSKPATAEALGGLPAGGAADAEALDRVDAETRRRWVVKALGRVVAGKVDGSTT